MNELIHIEGRVIIKVWIEEKNHHTFTDGTVIRLERKYDNFNRRETEPIQGEVVSSESIPKGATVLFHHNATDPVNEIFNLSLSGEEIASQVKYFSILEQDCFAWKIGDKDWMPGNGYAFALRVFNPYEGLLVGMEPTLMKDTLYMKTGQYAGLVVRTMKACDYEMVFREPKTGQERRIIRCRPDGDEKFKKEPEVVALDHGLTDKLNQGKVLVGLTKSDAKPLKDIQYA